MRQRRPLLQHRYEVHTHALSYKMLKGFWPLEYAPALTQSRTMHTHRCTHTQVSHVRGTLPGSQWDAHAPCMALSGCQTQHKHSSQAVEEVQGVRNHSCCP